MARSSTQGNSGSNVSENLTKIQFRIIVKSERIHKCKTKRIKQRKKNHVYWGNQKKRREKGKPFCLIFFSWCLILRYNWKTLRIIKDWFGQFWTKTKNLKQIRIFLILSEIALQLTPSNPETSSKWKNMHFNQIRNPSS